MCEIIIRKTIAGGVAREEKGDLNATYRQG